MYIEGLLWKMRLNVNILNATEATLYHSLLHIKVDNANTTNCMSPSSPYILFC